MIIGCFDGNAAHARSNDEPPSDDFAGAQALSNYRSRDRMRELRSAGPRENVELAHDATGMARSARAIEVARIAPARTRRSAIGMATLELTRNWSNLRHGAGRSSPVRDSRVRRSLDVRLRPGAPGHESWDTGTALVISSAPRPGPRSPARRSCNRRSIESGVPEKPLLIVC